MVERSPWRLATATASEIKNKTKMKTKKKKMLREDIYSMRYAILVRPKIYIQLATVVEVPLQIDILCALVQEIRSLTLTQLIIEQR